MKLDFIWGARSKILQRGSFYKKRSRKYANNLLLMQQKLYDLIFMMFFSSHFGEFMIFYIMQTIFILFSYLLEKPQTSFLLYYCVHKGSSDDKRRLKPFLINRLST